MRKLLLVLIIAAAAYGGWRFFFSAPGNAPAGMPPGMGGAPPVEVATVEKREVTVWDEFSGRLEAVERVEIRPRVAGNIEAVYFKEGERVKKGQALFLIDQRPYQAALQAAKARAQFAAAEFERARSLMGSQAVAKREFEQRRNEAEVAKADLTRAELDLNYTRITAPVSGRVSRAEITVGNLVGAGEPVLTRIVSENPVYADFDVDEQAFVRYLAAHGGNREQLKSIPVRLGLSGQPGFPHEGHIQSFDNELNTSAGTVRVRAVFPNREGNLIPGLFARLRVGGSGKQEAVLVPEQAVGTDQNRKFVYTVDDAGKAEIRVVRLGAAVEDMRVVEDGLKGGETIVVNGLQRVRPGTPVTPEAPGSGVQAPAGHSPEP